MAKKAAAKPAEAGPTEDGPAEVVESQNAPIEVAATEGRDPRKFIGYDQMGSGVYIYADAPRGWNRDRSVTIAKQHYEHVDEDADGVWLYRRM